MGSANESIARAIIEEVEYHDTMRTTTTRVPFTGNLTFAALVLGVVTGCRFSPEEGTWSAAFLLDVDDCGRVSELMVLSYDLTLEPGGLVFNWGLHSCSLEGRYFDCWYGHAADGMHGVGTGTFQDTLVGEFSDAMNAGGASAWSETCVDEDGQERSCETGWSFEAAFDGK